MRKSGVKLTWESIFIYLCWMNWFPDPSFLHFFDRHTFAATSMVTRVGDELFCYKNSADDFWRILARRLEFTTVTTWFDRDLFRAWIYWPFEREKLLTFLFSPKMEIWKIQKWSFFVSGWNPFWFQPLVLLDVFRKNIFPPKKLTKAGFDCSNLGEILSNFQGAKASFSRSESWSPEN